MVFVKVSETYDLSTQTNKMGIIGIHTPSVKRIMQVWGNAFRAHEKFRFASCDVTIACASMLPADPLQIGVEAGKIAPQDMFNPILYRAVSNDSYNTLATRIYGATPITPSNPIGGDLSINREDISSDAFALYYSLLAEPDGWRKAMPQSGLEMHGLYPLVYQMVNTFGNVFQYNDGVTPSGSDQMPSDEFQKIAASVGDTLPVTKKAYTFRGPSMRMPAIPTDIIRETVISEYEYDALDHGEPVIPATYVACIITPPAKLNVLYYRMKVTWTIELTGLRSDVEGKSLADLVKVGNSFYATDYVEQSSKMDIKSSSVDVKDANLELIMTSGA